MSDSRTVAYSLCRLVRQRSARWFLARVARHVLLRHDGRGRRAFDGIEHSEIARKPVALLRHVLQFAAGADLAQRPELRKDRVQLSERRASIAALLGRFFVDLREPEIDEELIAAFDLRAQRRKDRA